MIRNTAASPGRPALPSGSRRGRLRPRLSRCVRPGPSDLVRAAFRTERFDQGVAAHPAHVVAEVDLGVAVILANDDLVGDEEESLVFTIGKSFDL